MLDLWWFALHPSEANEELLERCLADSDRVVLDVVLRPRSLHFAEQPRPRQSRRPRDLVLNQPVMLVLEMGARERRAHEMHQGACLGLDGALLLAAADAQLDDERVTLAELGLEMLVAAEILEPAIDHHRHPRTQRLALLHAVRREYQGPAAVAHLHQRVPQLASRRRVDPGRRLVEEDDRRVADQRYADVQLALVATAEFAGLSVGIVLQRQLADQFFDHPVDVGRVDAAQSCVHPQRLAHGHLVDQRVELRTVADQVAHLLLPSPRSRRPGTRRPTRWSSGRSTSSSSRHRSRRADRNTRLSVCRLSGSRQPKNCRRTWSAGAAPRRLRLPDALRVFWRFAGVLRPHRPVFRVVHRRLDVLRIDAGLPHGTPEAAGLDETKDDKPDEALSGHEYQRTTDSRRLPGQVFGVVILARFPTDYRTASVVWLFPPSSSHNASTASG